MKLKIAIEPGLTPVSDFLESKGCSVEKLSNNNKSSNVDAYVVTGMNNNLMGIGTTETKAVVIDASGLTAEQVYNVLKERFE